jgi:Zn-dependent metalloprotease
MAKTLPIILILFVLAVSCEEVVEYNIPMNYPTTINKLSSTSLSQLRASYALKNQYVGTPPLQNIITQSEAIEKVKNFASRNPSETGVQNPNDLTFYKVSTTTGYGGAIGWHFKTANQKVDTIEVLYSMILIHLTNEEVSLCIGNWYPEIFIPSEFNVDQTKAKADLNGKVVSHLTFGGTVYYVTISKTDLSKSTIGLKVLPIENENKIELRVCWQIDIPGPVYYKFYVDVMTGKIIRQVPTIVS